ncbi:radical SAM protein [Patescibacteria group bacterium]|nr:radical SAM protein [Patescibacteria group bacterium]MBU1123118.1 radical SAM protein [Patescibacteria group bacterium]
MKQISLLQPRHSYAPEKGQGHVYSNTSLWTAASRIIQAGGEVTQIDDENLRPFEPKSDIVGMNVIGTAYINVVRKRMKDLSETRLVVGGQVINGLTGIDKFTSSNRTQMQTLFGKEVVNGNNDLELAALLGIKPEDLPPILETSLVPAYERISDEDMREYLSREISFFLSQGCKFGCRFCGEKNQRPEQYRNPDVLEADLTYLVERAQKLEINTLEMYLSNPDLFQTPDKLKEFAFIVQRVQRCHPKVRIKIRGLSRVDHFVKAHTHQPNVIDEMTSAGFHTIGFGIDGGTPETWAREKKGNTTTNCISAIRIAREEYNMTPEVLMVFGHQKETEKSLKAALSFTRDMIDLYQAVPRPHVSKDILPGSKYWENNIEEATLAEREDRTRRIRFLLENPEYFQALDFTTLPNSISHPDPELRRLTEKYYLAITQLKGNTTPVVYPIDPDFSDENNEENKSLNIGRYDR